MTHQDLMAGPPPTLLPADPAAAEIDSGEQVQDVVRRHPESPIAWATLAEGALADPDVDAVTAYAYARVGYHRSLDLLRRNGWKGHGPVPWEHEPNRLRHPPLVPLRTHGHTDMHSGDTAVGSPPRTSQYGSRVHVQVVRTEKKERRNRPLLRFRRSERGWAGPRGLDSPE